VLDVQYKSMEDVLRLVEKAGLEVDARYREEPSVEEGKVIGQSLEAGSVAKEGKIFYVSGLKTEEESETVEETEPEEESMEPETEAASETVAKPTEQPAQEDRDAGFQ